MFDGPEYESYIALCRELRLERSLELGDWYAHSEVDLQHPLVLGWREQLIIGPITEWTWVWLPRLDQWLMMLEEAGWMEVRFSPSAYLMDESPVFWRVEGSGIDRRYNVHTTVEYTDLRTREEAAARLWMAVAGRNKGEST
jgi:hypothetical protein